ncbi:MAG TPA: RIP metalloprotease RseP [Candidatus Doudnabacteria bacterium]|nr:RIP metalloprotease RseP [Candidatus Doudnabacteria bacterium]
MLVTIIIFIAVLSLLVFVHELGHFIMARRSGMGVHEFGFGFPPRVVGLQKLDGKWRVVWRKQESSPKATIYSINAIPLGGFVKIMGEDNDSADDPQSFTNKSFTARFFTLAAGVLMNVLTAWIIFSIGFMVGFPVAVNQLSDLPAGGRYTDQQILIGGVLPGSAAEAAGLAGSDIILSVDNQPISQISDLQDYIQANQGEELVFEVKRLTETLTIPVQTSLDTNLDEGIVGISMGYFGKLQYSLPKAFWHGAQTTIKQLGAIFKGLYNLFTSPGGFKQVGGPVLIAQYTGDAAEMGFSHLLAFIAFLSLNLAILNSLPIPALDGGRMLFLIIEKLRGKPNNQTIEQYTNAIGFMVLLLLMAVITARDVWQLESVKNLFG